MMGTRSGSVDPAHLRSICRATGKRADELDHILNKQSGLLGVSGLSGDMREILEAIEKGNERARLAYEIYAHRLTREIGAMSGRAGRRGRHRLHWRHRRKLRSAATRHLRTIWISRPEIGRRQKRAPSAGSKHRRRRLARSKCWLFALTKTRKLLGNVCGSVHHSRLVCNARAVLRQSQPK